MRTKKLKALALISAAVMAIANITASAEDTVTLTFEDAKDLCTETVDAHICRNYVNLDLEYRGYKGKKMVIKDQGGNVVARYTTGDKKFSEVRENILDISGMTSPKELDALKTGTVYITRPVRADSYVDGKPCRIVWKNEYLPPFSYESEGDKEVYPLLTSETYIYMVDNKSKFEDMKETYTVKAGDYAAYVDKSCSSVSQDMYFEFVKSDQSLPDNKILPDNAGAFFYDTMKKDTLSPEILIYIDKSGNKTTSTGVMISKGINKQDHDITYKMYRIKYADLIKNSAEPSEYEALLNYGKEPGKMVVLIASGSMMTYVTPDSDGYIKFWADPDDLGAKSIKFRCMNEDLKGTGGDLRMYRVIKLNPVMTMLSDGLTLYNIPEGTYTIEFEDAADKATYRITNNTFTVKDSTELQAPTTMTIVKERIGDVNNDGKIDVEDAVMVIGHVNGTKALTAEQANRANVDRNKKVDIEDAVAIIAHVNGIKVIE